MIKLDNVLFYDISDVVDLIYYELLVSESFWDASAYSKTMSEYLHSIVPDGSICLSGTAVEDKLRAVVEEGYVTVQQVISAIAETSLENSREEDKVDDFEEMFERTKEHYLNQFVTAPGHLGREDIIAIADIALRRMELEK